MNLKVVYSWFAAPDTSVDKPPVTNTKEEGLESLIFNSMVSFGWIAGKVGAKRAVLAGLAVYTGIAILGYYTGVSMILNVFNVPLPEDAKPYFPEPK